MNDSNVLPGIHAKKNALIYDFLADTHHKKQELCLMVDLSSVNAQTIATYFCEVINSSDYETLRFSFDSLVRQTPHVILIGKPQEVLNAMQQFYTEKNHRSFLRLQKRSFDADASAPLLVCYFRISG